MAQLEQGLRAELVHTVRPQDGADHWGNKLPVLATPVLLWLAEIASMQALEGRLEEDEMTVGLAHEATHLAPTPIGATVRLSASLVEVEGRRLRFQVEGFDADGMVYRGMHERALISATRFEQRVAEKQSRLVGTSGIHLRPGWARDSHAQSEGAAPRNQEQEGGERK